MTSPKGVSPELTSAVEALEQALKATDNPVGAARAVRRVAAWRQLPHDTSQKAFRLHAERLLLPFFSNDPDVAKAVTWLACDAGWDDARSIRGAA